MGERTRFCSVLWSRSSLTFLGLDRVQQRASWNRTTSRGSVGAVLRRDRLPHCFTWNLDIISRSPLLRHIAQVFCDSFWRLLEEFLEDFNVKVDTDPEGDPPVAHRKLELFLPAPLYLALDASVKRLLDEFHAFSP